MIVRKDPGGARDVAAAPARSQAASWPSAVLQKQGNRRHKKVKVSALCSRQLRGIEDHRQKIMHDFKVWSLRLLK